jgi:N6-adenosine-specific RNA methylase IME4
MTTHIFHRRAYTGVLFPVALPRLDFWHDFQGLLHTRISTSKSIIASARCNKAWTFKHRFLLSLNAVGRSGRDFV